MNLSLCTFLLVVVLAILVTVFVLALLKKIAVTSAAWIMLACIVVCIIVIHYC